jgi:uncharacterized membrane protein
MHRTLLLWLVIILAFIGIADSAYLTQSAYSQTPLTCNIDGLDGCNTVAQSVYSHLFGIPLSAYGLLFYILVFVLASAALVLPGIHARRGLYFLGIIGATASVVFVGIQMLIIKALCVYCLVSAIISFIVCFLGYRLYKKTYPLITTEQPIVEPW